MPFSSGGRLVIALASLVAVPVVANCEDWSQFRGPNASGVSSTGTIPRQLAPEAAAWKTRIPPGHSSPVVAEGRLFLTAFDEPAGRLVVLCLSRVDGRLLWQRTAPVNEIESHHVSASPAASTPVVHAGSLLVYFGSFGLVSYGLDGAEMWRKPLAMPRTPYGTATSPIVAAGHLYLNGQGREPYLLAVDPDTGATVWRRRTPRSGEAYSTPVVASREKGGTEIVVFGKTGIVAYDAVSGEETWWMTVDTLDAIATPAVGDAAIYLVSHSSAALNEGYQGTFDDLLGDFDANGDRRLGATEVPGSFLFIQRSADSAGDVPLLELFQYYDQDGDEALDETEWQAALQFRSRFDNALTAIRPGGEGELPPERLIWQHKRALPEVPSPLIYRGKLYLTKDGGLLTCLDATDGRVVYRGRLPARGQYYASPVAAADRILVASNSGAIFVLSAGDELDILSEQQFGERIFATPALAGMATYVRTEGHLYAFHDCSKPGCSRR